MSNPRIPSTHRSMRPDGEARVTAVGNRFQPVPGLSGLRAEAGLLALRMIANGKWTWRLLSHQRIRDADVLRLVGVRDTLDEEPLSTEVLQQALDQQATRLAGVSRKRPDALSRNISALAKPLKLSRDEQVVLRSAVLVTLQGSLFRDLFNAVEAKHPEIVCAFARSAGISASKVAATLSQDRVLRSCGILDSPDGSFEVSTSETAFEIDHSWLKTLLASRLDTRRVLRTLLRPSEKPSLVMTDFAHIAQVDMVLGYLREVLRRRRRGTNVLIHGTPGTGKTEFVRACAAALDAALFEVPNEDRDGDPISGRKRFGSYALCQRILANGERQILLFDEVEDVFGGGSCLGISGMSFGRLHVDADDLRKSWVNEVLETNPAPAFWVCNTIDSLDPAFLRRFDLVVEFRPPGRAVRRRMIDRYFRKNEISSRCAERLSEITALAPAQVERAARVARTLRVREAALRDANVEGIVRASLRAMGHPEAMPPPALPDYYDPAFLNADRDLEALTRGLRGRASARLCLYGPPGTGKTAFAHHLGRTLECPVLVQRASDLLSCWIGQTEHRIRQAFEQARDDGAILVIDEADGFLRDRASARASWDVTQVNELLTQMEAFEGIFIASTNLVEMLDAASLRRFDFKIRFDPMRRDQKRTLLARVCEESSTSHEQRDSPLRAACARIDPLDALTPGDFANVLRQLRATGEPPTPERVACLLASEAAMKPGASRRAIGFSPGNRPLSP